MSNVNDKALEIAEAFYQEHAWDGMTALLGAVVETAIANGHRVGTTEAVKKLSALAQDLDMIWHG